MKRKVVVVGAMAFALAAVAWLAPRGMLLAAMAHWLDVGVVPRRVDCVAGLPGDPNRRPFVVAALVNTGRAGQVLIPRTKDSPDEKAGISLTNAEVARRVLRHRGVPDSKIVVLPGASESTAGDLEILAEFVRTRPHSTLAIVTSAFHTRRARWTCRRFVGAAAMERIVFVSAPNPDFRASEWWHSEKGFRWILSEYVKLIAYWFRYGNGIWWCLLCVVLCVGVRTATKVRRRRSSSRPRRP